MYRKFDVTRNFFLHSTFLDELKKNDKVADNLSL
jgi:hypothetical protein